MHAEKVFPVTVISCYILSNNYTDGMLQQDASIVLKK